jgi:hypothetical protein
MKKIILMQIVLLYAILSLGAECSNETSDSGLPNSSLTPGSFYIFVSRADICREWYISSVPRISFATKKKVMQRYNLPIDHLSEYTIDRLIPAELGGNNSFQNLWPEKKDLKRFKDELGNKLGYMVCNRRLALIDAQKEISINWIKAYKKYVREEMK